MKNNNWIFTELIPSLFLIFVVIYLLIESSKDHKNSQKEPVIELTEQQFMIIWNYANAKGEYNGIINLFDAEKRILQRQKDSTEIITEYKQFFK